MKEIFLNQCTASQGDESFLMMTALGRVLKDYAYVCGFVLSSFERYLQGGSGALGTSSDEAVIEEFKKELWKSVHSEELDH